MRKMSGGEGKAEITGSVRPGLKARAEQSCQGAADRRQPEPEERPPGRRLQAQAELLAVSRNRVDD